MAQFRSSILAAAAFLAIGALPAHAALMISGSVGGAPTGVIYENFDALVLPPTGSGILLSSGITITMTPGAQAVTGSAVGRYASPFVSGSNGTGFGNANGADTSVYITSGSSVASVGARVTLGLPFLTHYFGLLWGSVDAYNMLEFFDGTTLVGTVTGSDVIAGAYGNQGVNGTRYVNINSTIGFNNVVATSSGPSFEFDNVALNATAIPEPASLAVLCLGLLALGFAQRAKRRAD